MYNIIENSSFQRRPNYTPSVAVATHNLGGWLGVTSN